MNYTSLEAWQETLYPLGLISTVFFGIRFFFQLWASEKRGRSVVTNSFWHCSILGNATLALHAAIQLQLPIAILQGLQLVLAKRNLEIAAPNKPSLYRLVIPTLLILGALLVIFFAFSGSELEWMRIPATPWSKGEIAPPLLLEILGIIGIFLFSSRFFFQWWEAEKLGESHLSANFWGITLMGAFLSSLYFIYCLDIVNLLGPLFGSLGAARNFILSRRTK